MFTCRSEPWLGSRTPTAHGDPKAAGVRARNALGRIGSGGPVRVRTEPSVTSSIAASTACVKPSSWAAPMRDRVFLKAIRLVGPIAASSACFAARRSARSASCSALELGAGGLVIVPASSGAAGTAGRYWVLTCHGCFRLGEQQPTRTTAAGGSGRGGGGKRDRRAAQGSVPPISCAQVTVLRGSQRIRGQARTRRHSRSGRSFRCARAQPDRELVMRCPVRHRCPGAGG